MHAFVAVVVAFVAVVVAFVAVVVAFVAVVVAGCIWHACMWYVCTPRTGREPFKIVSTVTFSKLKSMNV
jgi:hypothetical protein